MKSFEQKNEREGWLVRLAQEGDIPHLHRWLSDPEIAHGFPCGDPEEVDDCAKRWVEFYKEGGALAIEIDGEVAGIAVLFLQSCIQLIHQCMHIVIVDPAHRRKGVGTFLLDETMRWAKEGLGIELFHCEVTEGSEATSFYRSLGFEQFAFQPDWIKEGDRYYGRHLFEKIL